MNPNSTKTTGRHIYKGFDRKQNVRAQTTKDKSGTLPLYAYTTVHEQKEPLDFTNMLAHGQNEPKAVIHKKGEVLLFMQNRIKHIGVVRRDITDDEEELAITVYQSEELDMFRFVPQEDRSIDPELLVGKPQILLIDECVTLSEDMYNDIFTDSPPHHGH